MEMNSFRVDRRFCGPPLSANGGYVCAHLAAYVEPPAVVRLLAPPPLEEELRVEVAGGGARLFHGSTPVAEARSGDWQLEAPPAPSFSEAQAASLAYLGFTDHAFPRCFVCGPQREEGDGLRVFPGAVPGTSLVAAPWVPAGDLAAGSGAVAVEFLWAALDCTGAFAVLPVPRGRAILLGEFSVRLGGAVVPGEPCVLVGWQLGVAGRKRLAGSALYGEDGGTVAVARATWIEVASGAFSGG